MRADSVTFDFTGTLASYFNGSDAVSGQFTLDTSTSAVTAFDFATPLVNISPPDWDGGWLQVTPVAASRGPSDGITKSASQRSE